MFFNRIFYLCSLICVLCFCLVTFLCFFCLLVPCILFFCMLFVRVKSYHEKKKKKRFKTALITSFILLLTSHNFFIIQSPGHFVLIVLHQFLQQQMSFVTTFQNFLQHSLKQDFFIYVPFSNRFTQF